MLAPLGVNVDTYLSIYSQSIEMFSMELINCLTTSGVMYAVGSPISYSSCWAQVAILSSPPLFSALPNVTLPSHVTSA